MAHQIRGSFFSYTPYAYTVNKAPLDRTDFPIAGASVKLKLLRQMLETKSDGKGHFEFVVPPETQELEVSARWFETRVIKSLRITGPRTVMIILDIGKLSDCCEDRIEPAKKDLQTKSDSTGRFTFGHVRSGRYTIIVSAEGFRAKTIEGVQITAEDPASLRVTLDAADSP